MERQRGHGRAGLAAALFLVLLFSAACGGMVETDLTLLSGERWEATTKLTVPLAMLQIVGPQVLEQQLDQAVQEAGPNEKASWKKVASDDPQFVSYLLDYSGKGYDSLDGLCTIEKVQVGGKPALRVKPDSGISADATSTVFRLHAGEILDTNGVRQGKGDVVWTNNLHSAYAVVTPKAGLSGPALIAAILAAAAALSALGLLLWRRSAGKMQPAPGYAVPQQPAPPPALPAQARTVFCPYCGAQGQVAGRFCMSCGKSIPPQ
jgi:hypothetical protein